MKTLTRDELMAQKEDLEARLAIVRDPENNEWLLEEQLSQIDWLLGG